MTTLSHHQSTPPPDPRHRPILIYSGWDTPAGVLDGTHFGSFCVHQDASPGRRALWTVSHTLTGAAILKSLSLAHALALASELQSLDRIGLWSFTTQEEFMAVRHILRPQLRQTLLRLGIRR